MKNGDEQPRLGRPETVAAGLKAIVESFRFAVRETGLVRGLGTWFKVNKKDGFDCQSCAWPSGDHERNVFEFCENGAKAVASETTRKQITARFFREHSIADLEKQSDYWLEQQGRLVEPVVKKSGATHYEPVSWDDAFALLGRELNALPTPDAAAFYTSGRTSNEAAFLYQLFVRQFGTNNLPDCSNMCHESSGVALGESIGIGKGCVKLTDFALTDAIFILGQNPGTNHPRMMSTLEAARRAGAKIVSINPLREPGLTEVANPNPQEYGNILEYPVRMISNRGVQLSNLWLPVKINGDMAALRGVMKEMLAEEDRAPGSIFDWEFIRQHTNGFEPFLENLRATAWEEIVEGSGLSRAEIRAAAEIAMQAHNIICCWAMGLTQHKNAVPTIQEVMNFLLLRGNIGRRGAGPCPVRGHSNVQGDRTVGITARAKDGFLDRLGAEFGFLPPRHPGADTVETIRKMHAGEIRFFFAMGGNFLSASPDTEYTAQALGRCRVTAHVSTKLNRAHLVTGEIALILPCLGRSEIDRQEGGDQFVTVEDSMGIINPSRGHLEPASPQLRSEPAIVAGLATAALGSRSTVDWGGLVANYDRIRHHIERVVPGFEKYNERIRQDIFYLPNPARDRREFNTPTGKANFVVTPLTWPRLEPGEFLLMTIRSHDQFNTTVYGLNDRYRGVYHGRRVVFMNPADVTEARLQQGQVVDITSTFGGTERVARKFMVAPFEIPRRCVATYFPEANVLVPIDSTADRSNTPTSKSVAVRITPVGDAESEEVGRELVEGGLRAR